MQCVAVHGDISQSQRTAAVEKFKSGEVPLLIATDVAARGLDIPDVEAVINYSFPLTTEDYVHRIGRTGRAGKTGVQSKTKFCHVSSRDRILTHNVTCMTWDTIQLSEIHVFKQLDSVRQYSILRMCRKQMHFYCPVGSRQASHENCMAAVFWEVYGPPTLM